MTPGVTQKIPMENGLIIPIPQGSGIWYTIGIDHGTSGEGVKNKDNGIQFVDQNRSFFCGMLGCLSHDDKSLILVELTCLQFAT